MHLDGLEDEQYACSVVMFLHGVLVGWPLRKWHSATIWSSLQGHFRSCLSLCSPVCLDLHHAHLFHLTQMLPDINGRNVIILFNYNNYYNLKGNYTLRLSNVVLNITFKRNSLKYIKVYFLEMEFYKEHIGNVKF